MAYFSSSNYEQYYDNYQFYQPYYNNNDEYDAHESRYVQYGYNDHTQYYNNEFQLAPSQSLVGYYCSNNNNNNNNNDFLASKNSNFHENGNYYYDPVSTQFVISYNISEKEANDLVFEEYNPEPFHGGYDIHETYGKALPPSTDICYPPTKINPNLSVSLPYGKNDQKLEGLTKPETNLIGSGDEDEDEDEDSEDEDEDSGKQDILQNFDGGEKPKSNLALEENVIDSEEDEDEDEDSEDEDEDEDSGKQDILQNFDGGEKPKSNLALEENVIDYEEDEDEDEDDENEGGKEGIASEVPPSKVGEEGKEKEGGISGNEDGYGKEIRRQIPAGYGMEAIDICEGIFGGYFPCLLKKNRGGSCKQCGIGSGIKSRIMDDYECWQGTVDYFFGNPNPYGGSMPEKGSYGDPMFAYQRYYPQESIVGEVKYGESHDQYEYDYDYSRYN